MWAKVGGLLIWRESQKGKRSILKSFAGDGKELTASECVSYPITVTGAKVCAPLESDQYAMGF